VKQHLGSNFLNHYRLDSKAFQASLHPKFQSALSDSFNFLQRRFSAVGVDIGSGLQHGQSKGWVNRKDLYFEEIQASRNSLRNRLAGEGERSIVKPGIILTI
jgi:hypothetical protein